MNQDFVSFVKVDSKILIICSQPLDLDSLGSGLLLKKYVESLGKKTSLVFPRPFTDQEKEGNSFLPYFNEIEDRDTRDLFKDKQFDSVIFIDGTSLTQYYDTDKSKDNPPNLETYDKRIHIDHHLNLVDPLGKLVIRDNKIGSTMEVLLTHVIPLEFLDQQTATLAYGSIVGDTGNFRHSLTENTFRLAASLIELGADWKLIVHKVFDEKPKDYFNLFSWVISQVEFNDDIKTIFLTLTQKVIQDKGLNEDQLSLVKDIFKSEIAHSTKGYDRGVVIEEKIDARIKVSARGSGNNKINLPETFKQIDKRGGGHFSAAGFETEGKMVDEVKQNIIEEFRKNL